jgi:hypothetical protein
MKKFLLILLALLLFPCASFAEDIDDTMCQPFDIANGGGSVSFTNFTINSSAGTADIVVWCFQADTTDAITDLGFRYGARTGTPPTYRISLQGASTSGIGPDGTVLGGGSPASQTFTPPADTSINGLWQWKTLANSYTPTRGQFLCSVIEYSSGTIDGSNNSSFTKEAAGLLSLIHISEPTRPCH